MSINLIKFNCLRGAIFWADNKFIGIVFEEATQHRAAGVGRQLARFSQGVSINLGIQLEGCHQSIMSSFTKDSIMRRPINDFVESSRTSIITSFDSLEFLRKRAQAYLKCN